MDRFANYKEGVGMKVFKVDTQKIEELPDIKCQFCSKPHLHCERGWLITYLKSKDEYTGTCIKCKPKLCSHKTSNRNSDKKVKNKQEIMD